MADRRLQLIAADAVAAGWQISWVDTPDRCELIVSDASDYGMGFGVTLGGKEVSLWVWESLGGCLIVPWNNTHRKYCPQEELHLFPKVTCFDDALPIFTAAVRRNESVMSEWDTD